MAEGIALMIDPPKGKRKTWGAKLYVGGKAVTTVAAKDVAGLMDGLIPWIERAHDGTE